jgi:hypothetical protein
MRALALLVLLVPGLALAQKGPAKMPADARSALRQATAKTVAAQGADKLRVKGVHETVTRLAKDPDVKAALRTLDHQVVLHEHTGTVKGYQGEMQPVFQRLLLTKKGLVIEEASAWKFNGKGPWRMSSTVRSPFLPTKLAKVLTLGLGGFRVNNLRGGEAVTAAKVEKAVFDWARSPQAAAPLLERFTQLFGPSEIQEPVYEGGPD